MNANDLVPLSTPEQFSVWVIKLNGKVDYLHRKVRRKDVNVLDLEHNLNTLNAMLNQLYSYAFQHRVDVMQFQQHLVKIETRLHEISSIVQRRKTPWWMKLLSVVSTAIKVVSAILGLPSLPTGERIPRLPG